MKNLYLLKRISLTIIILMSGVFVWAQTNWAFQAPGISGTAPTSPLVENCIDQDLQGNIFVSSTTVDSIQFGSFAFAGYQLLPSVPIFMENAYISKLNSNGEVQWVSKISASVFSRIYDLKVDNAGDVFVVGSVFGDAVFDTVSIPEIEELFLAKYGTDGRLKWVTTTVSPSATPPQGVALAIGNDQNIYISGSISEVSNFQNIQVDVGADSHFFIAKFTNDGVVDWVNTYGYTFPNSQTVGLDLDSDNNIYLSGVTVGISVFDTITINATEGSAYFLAKFNENGNIAWLDVIKYKSVNSARLVVDRQLNQIYVTGYFFYETVQFGDVVLQAPVYPGKTLFLAKYDAAKNVIWAKANGGDVQVVRAKGIDISADGSVFVCGEYGEGSQAGVGVVFGEGADAVALKKKGTFDGFVVKYNNDGSLNWAQALSGPENDDARDVVAFGNDFALVTGIFVDSIYINDISFSSKPISYAGNFYLASCDGSSSPSSIFNINKKELNYNIVPNPASSHISFIFDEPRNTEIIAKIYNISGKLLINKMLKAPRELLNIKILPPGVYVVHLMGKHKNYLGNSKLIVK